MGINLLLNSILFIGMVSFLCMSIYRRNKYNKIKKELEDLKNTPVPTMTITTKRLEQVNLEKEYRIPKYELDLSDEKNEAMIYMIQRRLINDMVDQIYPYVDYIHDYNYDPMHQVQVIRARLRVLK